MNKLSAYGHITLRIPVPVRSPKSNSVELCQYMDGRPPWNTECCKLFAFDFFDFLKDEKIRA